MEAIVACLALKLDRGSAAETLRRHLAPFREHEPLPQRILHVLAALPSHVLHDFLLDHRFQLLLDNFVPGHGRTVRLASPGPDGGSRSVVLKPRLARCAEAFAHYIIAHEFAHAFLRNGGWGDLTDPEQAADALATQWGFAPQPYPY